MKKLLIVVLCFFAMLANAQQETNQTDEAGRKQGPWIKLQDNGKPLYEGTFVDDKPVGEFKRFHPNGRLMALFNYMEGTDSASVEMYSEDGKLIASGYYVDQLRNGEWTFFKDGQKISVDNYIGGVKNGKSKTFYTDSGELFEESDWVDGLQTGVYRAYFKNGKPYFECQMSEGKRNGFCQSFFENGQLEMEASYVQDLRDGEWKYYDENGNLAYTLIYEYGELQNPEVQDSIETSRLKILDQNQGKITDPEKFMNDPALYMQEAGIH